MTEAYLRRDCCPICGAAAPSTPAVRSTPPAESLPFGEHGAFLSGYDSRRVFFTYHRCGACGGLYCPVYFTQSQLDQLYSGQPENTAEVPVGAREATQRAYFEIFRRHAVLDGEYLELGPDIGLFTHLCARHGRFTRFHLFEPNREVHVALRAGLAGHDVALSAAAYAAGAVGRDRLSAAVAIHVLDHVLDPATLLGDLRAALAPGGTLFVVTHDAASWLARLLGRRWPPYTLQHPQLFSPRSLATLLRRCGFEVVCSLKTPSHFPATHLLRALLALFGAERRLPRLDHSVTVRLQLGNIATVAVKPARAWGA